MFLLKFNNFIKLITFLILLLIGSLYSSSSLDSLAERKEKPREFSQKKLNQFKNLEEFNYTEARRVNSNPIGQFLAWLWKNSFGYILGRGDATFWEIIIYFMAIFFIIFAIRQFIRIKISPVLYQSSNGLLIKQSYPDDNIFGKDFDSLLNASITEKDFRLAVRILYLMLIKNLNDNKKISWHFGKTNQQLSGEIENTNLRNYFLKLTWIYECIWYGKFNIDSAKFRSVHKNFSDINLILEDKF